MKNSFSLHPPLHSLVWAPTYWLCFLSHIKKRICKLISNPKHYLLPQPYVDIWIYGPISFLLWKKNKITFTNFNIHIGILHCVFFCFWFEISRSLKKKILPKQRHNSYPHVLLHIVTWYIHSIHTSIIHSSILSIHPSIHVELSSLTFYDTELIWLSSYSLTCFIFSSKLLGIISTINKNYLKSQRFQDTFNILDTNLKPCLFFLSTCSVSIYLFLICFPSLATPLNAEKAGFNLHNGLSLTVTLFLTRRCLFTYSPRRMDWVCPCQREMIGLSARYYRTRTVSKQEFSFWIQISQIYHVKPLKPVYNNDEFKWFLW